MAVFGDWSRIQTKNHSPEAKGSVNTLQMHDNNVEAPESEVHNLMGDIVVDTSPE